MRKFKSVQFELTPTCNLACKTCYIHENTEAGRPILPASFWIAQAQQAVDQGMLVLSLTGGETLLYPELDILMDAVSRMGLLISFNTNGTLVDEKRVEWFLKYCPNKINISLYGATDETYEKMCRTPKGFTRTAKAIDLLMKAGLNVYLNGILTPYNIHELKAMHKFAAERGLILHTSAYAFPLRTYPGMNVRGEYRFTPQDAARATAENNRILYGRKQAAIMAAASIAEVDARIAGKLCDSSGECSHGECSSGEGNRGACNGGVSNFHISYDGNLHPCAMLQKISASLTDQPFAEAMQKVTRQMKEFSFPTTCTVCPRSNICPACKAAVYLETGNEEQAPAYLCAYSEALEQILRKECADVQVELPYSGNFNIRHCTE